jgi:hypothetical protein
MLLVGEGESDRGLLDQKFESSPFNGLPSAKKREKLFKKQNLVDRFRFVVRKIL